MILVNTKLSITMDSTGHEASTPINGMTVSIVARKRRNIADKNRSAFMSYRHIN